MGIHATVYCLSSVSGENTVSSVSQCKQFFWKNFNWNSLWVCTLLSGEWYNNASVSNILKYFLSETAHTQENGSRGAHFAKFLISNFLCNASVFVVCFTSNSMYIVLLCCKPDNYNFCSSSSNACTMQESHTSVLQSTKKCSSRRTNHKGAERVRHSWSGKHSCDLSSFDDVFFVSPN